jgi:hypothetical protein
MRPVSSAIAMKRSGAIVPIDVCVQRASASKPTIRLVLRSTRWLVALQLVTFTSLLTQGLETNADADTSSAEAATAEAPTTDAHTNAGTRRIVAGSICQMTQSRPPPKTSL